MAFVIFLHTCLIVGPSDLYTDMESRNLHVLMGQPTLISLSTFLFTLVV